MAGNFVDGAIITVFKDRPELTEQRIGRLFHQHHIPLADLGHVHVVDGSPELLKLGEQLLVFKRELDPLVDVDNRTDAHLHSEPVFVPLFHGPEDLCFSRLHKSVLEDFVEAFVL